MTIILALMAAVGGLSDPVADPDDQRRPDDIVVTGQRTEGSDDYGLKAQTTATRLPLSLKETPQSVSVVTRAQIDDFQLNDVNALLATVPGVNVQAAETDRFYYSARGFDIQTFQIDGIGLPFAFEVQTGSIDTATYDHIEVVRGAPGLLSSTGNPSAVVNFIRKRPGKAFPGVCQRAIWFIRQSPPRRRHRRAADQRRQHPRPRGRRAARYRQLSRSLSPSPLDRIWDRRGGPGAGHRYQRGLWTPGSQEHRCDVGFAAALLYRRHADRPQALDEYGPGLVELERDRSPDLRRHHARSGQWLDREGQRDPSCDRRERPDLLRLRQPRSHDRARHRQLSGRVPRADAQPDDRRERRRQGVDLRARSRRDAGRQSQRAGLWSAVELRQCRDRCVAAARYGVRRIVPAARLSGDL